MVAMSTLKVILSQSTMKREYTTLVNVHLATKAATNMTYGTITKA
jgi:hypothetical protein